MITAFPAHALSKKYLIAQGQLKKAKRIVKRLEHNIEKELGSPMLCEWQEEEENFKAKVVDMKEHQSLMNPYEAKHDMGTDSGTP